MKMHRMTALSLALGGALLLAGCGGGGGGGGGGSAPSSVSMSVTPTLGYFFSGTVTVTDASGNTVGTGSVSNGAVQLQVPASYNGATLIVKVSGGSYWDEALKTQVTQTQPLYALIPSFSSAANTVAVNPLTNAAAAMLLQGNGTLPANTTASAVVQANSTLAALVGLAGVDIVSTVPSPIKSVADKLSGTAPADLVEAKLAALAYLAKTDGVSADGEAASLAQQVANSVASAGGTVTKASLGNNTAASLNTATSAAVAVLAGDDPTVEQSLDSSAYQAVSGTLPPAVQTAITNGSTSPLLGEVASAKTFFAALRSGVLPYSNPLTGTGVLDVQAPKLGQELAPLGQGVNGVHELAELIKLTSDFYNSTTPNVPCMPGTNTNSTVCTLPQSNGETLTLTFVTKTSTSNTVTGTWNWALSNGPTGTMQVTRPTQPTSSSLLTIVANGELDASTPSGSYTQVGTGNATKLTCQNPMQPLTVNVPLGTATASSTLTAQVQGDVSDMVADNVSGLKSCSGFSPDMALHFGDSSNTPGRLTVNQSDPTQDTLNVTASLLTRDFTLQGSLQIPSQLSSATPGAVVPTGTPVVLDASVGTAGLQYVDASNTLAPENGSTAAGYTLLNGELKASANLGSGVSSYDPQAAASASNNLTTSVTFTGQVFDSATDPGLKLQLGWGRSWSASVGNYADTLSLGYYDLPDNLTITAAASATEPNAQLTQVTLTAGNGVSATWQPGQASTTVKDGSDNVGTLSGGRVTYVDGSYQSVY